VLSSTLFRRVKDPLALKGMRGAIPKSGGNASLAGESGRYADV
jgi:hypothetical protein